jgi:hypothetical protein
MGKHSGILKGAAEKGHTVDGKTLRDIERSCRGGTYCGWENTRNKT